MSETDLLPHAFQVRSAAETWSIMERLLLKQYIVVLCQYVLVEGNALFIHLSINLSAAQRSERKATRVQPVRHIVARI